MKALGIDPGTKNLGYAIVKKENGQLLLEKGGILVNTDEKSTAFRLIYKQIKELIQENDPEILAYEIYNPWIARTGSSKIVVLTGILLGCFYNFENKKILATTSKQLHNHFEIEDRKMEDVLSEKVVGMEKIRGLPKKIQEHVIDAIGHAVIGLEKETIK